MKRCLYCNSSMIIKPSWATVPMPDGSDIERDFCIGCNMVIGRVRGTAVLVVLEEVREIPPGHLLSGLKQREEL